MKRAALRLLLATAAVLAAAAPAAAQAGEDPTPGNGKKVDHVALLRQAIADPSKVVIVQTAPAVRVAIGEMFGMGSSDTTGRLVTSLRKLGFDYVYDTLSGADLTTMEEGHEMIARLNAFLEDKEDAPALPMFTSCCPGWVGYVEDEAADLIPHLSTCKSPHMMVGAMVKRFFAQKIGRNASDIVMTSIMPCYKKQWEADRIDMQTPDGAREVDHVVTTKQLGAWLQREGIDYPKLDNSTFDDWMGVSTGSGALYGVTGGVTESVLRTVYELCSGQKLDKLEFPAVRGLQGVKEATVVIPVNPEGPLKNKEPFTLKVAVASGLEYAAPLLDAVRNGTNTYNFLEVMNCDGGCINGEGQPESDDPDIVKKRAAALYSADERAVIRRAHENPAVLQLYKDYLGEPNSELAEEVLHTTYVEGGPELYDWRLVIDGESGNLGNPSNGNQDGSGKDGANKGGANRRLLRDCNC